MTYATYPSLRDRVVLVTGGGSGIGAAIVEHFSAQGSRVAFLDIDRAAASACARRSPRAAATGRSSCTAICGTSPPCARAVAEVRRQLGPIRVLVNNAAHDERHALDTVTPEYWDDRLAVNLRHQFFAAQAVYPDMAAAGGGAIVNLGSTSWMAGQGGMPGYTTAKSGVVGLTRGLARDLGPHEIRVTCVVPGWIMTERQIKLWLTPEAEAELLRRQCLKRKLVPEDIARAILFFAADDSAGCTAQSYVVDAGWT